MLLPIDLEDILYYLENIGPEQADDLNEMTRLEVSMGVLWLSSKHAGKGITGSEYDTFKSLWENFTGDDLGQIMEAVREAGPTGGLILVGGIFPPPTV